MQTDKYSDHLNNKEDIGSEPEAHSDDFEDVDKNGLDEGGYVDDLLGEDINDDSDPFLDLTDKDTPCFIIKVPEYLKKELLKRQEEGLKIGRFTKYPYKVIPEGVSDSAKCILHLPDDTPDEIPRDYAVELVPSQPDKTFIFEEFRNKTGRRIIGKVVEEGKARPFEGDVRAEIMMRKRTLEAGEEKEAITYDTSTSQHHLNHLRPVAYQHNAANSFGGLGKKPRIDPDLRAARMPEKQLRDLLFQCFKQYAYWSFNGLLKKTKQPSAHLKNVLKEIAILNKRGKHHTLYQLLPEYKEDNDFEDADENPENNPFNNDGAQVEREEEFEDEDGQDEDEEEDDDDFEEVE